MNNWKTLETKKDESRLLAGLIDEADAVVVGIGAGMSAADGFTYTGERFTRLLWLSKRQRALVLPL